MFDIWPSMNKCTVVAKRELFFAWPFGLAAWLCGLIFINRMQTDRAREQLDKAAELIKLKKIKLWIFPEGTRRNTGHMHPFKKGAFHIAINAQLPIQPVVYSSYRTFLDDKKKVLNSGKVIISTLPPISTNGMTTHDLERLMQHTYDMMNREYQLISNEIAEQYKLTQDTQDSKQQTTSMLYKNTNETIELTTATPISTPTAETLAIDTAALSAATTVKPSVLPSTPSTNTRTKINNSNNNNINSNSNHNINSNNNGRHFLLEENNVFNQYTFMQQHHRSATAPTAN